MLDMQLLNQIDWMITFQAMTNWIVEIFRAISRLGDEEFFLFIAPVIYWCFSTRVGLRVGIYLMLSGGVNYAFKLFFAQPRPYWMDPRVIAYHTESSFGFPSGHAQHATVFWGALAASARQPAALILAGLLIFLIGVSRVIVGVHFISDVIAGWMIGVITLFVLLRLEKPALAWLKRQMLAQQVLYLFAGSVLLVGIGILARAVHPGWEMPSEWLANAIAASPNGEAPDPMALSGLITNAGAFFGLAAGALWTDLRRGFDPGGVVWKRLARFLVGVMGVAILWFGLGAVFPRGESVLPYILRYIRYALIGFWVTGIAPWLFIRLSLANPKLPEG